MSNGANSVRAAWIIEGRSPLAHRAAQEKLRQEWPALATAIETLVAEARAAEIDAEARTRSLLL